MSNGIAHNNLNDISKIYLDTISDINKKEQSDDVKRWQQEETGCETKSESPFRKKKVKAYKESLSNWRTDLREITSDAEATEIDNQPEIKEKKVKNKIKINPEFKEAVKQMGGELLEVKEVDSPDGETDDKPVVDKKKEQDDAAAKKIADKERKLKMRILRVKMMATKQDAGASIVAGYEPKVNAIKKLVNERLGGKGYKKRKDYAGRTVSGDWEDSDRGAGNKAKKRAGGKVEKKSPTYIAHVLNKEEVVHEGDVHSGQGEKIQKRTKAWMDKKGQKGAPGLNAMKARTAEHKSKRGVKEEEKKKGRHPRDQKELDRAQAYIKKNPKFGVKEDKAFNLVRDRLKKQYGDGVLTTGEKPKPPTAKQKAEYAAHKKKLAKQDHRDPTEKASDGRYSDRHSNRGSD